MKPTLKILSCLLVAMNFNYLRASSGMVELKQNVNDSAAFRATQSVLSENSDILGRTLEIHPTEDSLRAATVKILKSELNGMQESTAAVEIANPTPEEPAIAQESTPSNENYTTSNTGSQNQFNSFLPNFNLKIDIKKPEAEQQPSIDQVEVLSSKEPKSAIIGSVPDSSIQIGHLKPSHTIKTPEEQRTGSNFNTVSTKPSEAGHQHVLGTESAEVVSPATIAPSTLHQSAAIVAPEHVKTHALKGFAAPDHLKTQGDSAIIHQHSSEKHEPTPQNQPKSHLSGFKKFMSERLSDLNSFAKDIASDVAPALRSNLRKELVGYDYKALNEHNKQHEEELKHLREHHDILHHHHIDNRAVQAHSQHPHSNYYTDHHIEHQNHQPEQLQDHLQHHQHERHEDRQHPHPHPHPNYNDTYPVGHHQYYEHHHHQSHKMPDMDVTVKPVTAHIHHATENHQHHHDQQQHVDHETVRPVPIQHHQHEYMQMDHHFINPHHNNQYGYYTPNLSSQLNNMSRPFNRIGNEFNSPVYHPNQMWPPIPALSSPYAEPEREVFIPIRPSTAFGEKNDPLLNWFKAKSNKNRSKKRRNRKSSFITSPYQNMTMAEQLMKRKGKFMYPQLVLNDFGFDSTPPPPEKGSIVSYGFTL